jgi:hypothetical protein
MPTYQIQTHVHVFFIPVHNAIVYTMHKRACEQATYCTHVSVWSVELWASAAAMCCAPFEPMKLAPSLYAHVCGRRTIQRTCVAHDTRYHTYNRVRAHIYPHACVHADISNTNTRACLARIPSAQHNSIYHTQACPTTMHSCEQATYCTHLSVWSVEL